MSKKNVIFSNDYCDMSKAIAEEIGKDPEPEEVYDNIDAWFEGEMVNLDQELDGFIFAVGTIVRWNGTVNAYKRIGSNLKDCLCNTFDLSENTVTLYEKNGRLYAEATGHDNPCSPSVIEFRLFRTDSEYDTECELEEYLTEDNYIEKAEAASEPIGDYVAKVYGFKAA